MPRPKSLNPRPAPKRTKEEVLALKQERKQKILAYLESHPDAGPTEIARACGISPSYVPDLKAEALRDKAEIKAREAFMLGRLWHQVVEVNKNKKQGQRQNQRDKSKENPNGK